MKTFISLALVVLMAAPAFAQGYQYKCGLFARGRIAAQPVCPPCDDDDTGALNTLLLLSLIKQNQPLPPTEQNAALLQLAALLAAIYNGQDNGNGGTETLVIPQGAPAAQSQPQIIVVPQAQPSGIQGSLMLPSARMQGSIGLRPAPAVRYQVRWVPVRR